LLDPVGVCRDIAAINRTRGAGGFSGRLSPGNQLALRTLRPFVPEREEQSEWIPS
jgi:hypothetical protein